MAELLPVFEITPGYLVPPPRKNPPSNRNILWAIQFCQNLPWAITLNITTDKIESVKKNQDV